MLQNGSLRKLHCILMDIVAPSDVADSARVASCCPRGSRRSNQW
jgi:hypothetical protein